MKLVAKMLVVVMILALAMPLFAEEAEAPAPVEKAEPVDYSKEIFFRMFEVSKAYAEEAKRHNAAIADYQKQWAEVVALAKDDIAKGLAAEDVAEKHKDKALGIIADARMEYASHLTRMTMIARSLSAIELEKFAKDLLFKESK